MILKPSSALVLIAAAAVPALAQVKSGNAITSGEAMKAPMKPMTATEKALSARCAKMSPAAAKKNAGCAKISALQPAAPM